MALSGPELPLWWVAAVTDNRVIFGVGQRGALCRPGHGQGRVDVRDAGEFSVVPVVSAPSERVVIGSDDGRGSLLARVGRRTEVWNYDIGHPVQSSPAVAGGRFVIGAHDGVIYCFGSK